MGKYNLEDINQRKEKGESWKEIGEVYGEKPETVRRAWNRMKDKQEKEVSMRDIKEVTPQIDLQKTSQLESQKPEPKMESKEYLTENDLDDYMENLKKTAGISEYLVENGKAEIRLINKGDLVNLVVDAIQGRIPIDSEKRTRLKKGCGKVPFEGTAKGSGGWNSIIYSVIDLIEKSERVFVLKGD